MSEIEHHGVVAMAADNGSPDVPRVFIRWATGEDGSLRIRKWSQGPHEGAVEYTATPAPHDLSRGHLAVTCSDEEAISFLETACRNWSHVPRLSKDDLADVATALVHFVARKTAAATEADHG